jgi:hypothetical protein
MTGDGSERIPEPFSGILVSSSREPKILRKRIEFIF